MFGKLMNNYYYGKSGKGDYTPDDLPKNRWQLFLEMLRTRFSGLVRLNLLYMLVWLPTIIVLMWGSSGVLNALTMVDDTRVGQVETIEQADGSTMEFTYISSQDFSNATLAMVNMVLLLLVPCIAITGPATAGVCYVTRNWARDEHAFIWSDFKDAVKENWKQSLVISCITSLMPLVIYFGWRFYGQMSQTQPLMVLPQVLVVMIGLIWSLAVTYMHPLIVSYKLRLRDLFRNGLLLAVARLPMSVGIRLLHVLPLVLTIGIGFLTNNIALLLLLPLAWYVLIGFTLSRFVTASYTNGVFDKYINSRIEGAQVDRGLAKDLEDDEDEDDGDETPDA